VASLNTPELEKKITREMQSAVDGDPCPECESPTLKVKCEIKLGGIEMWLYCCLSCDSCDLNRPHGEIISLVGRS